MSDETTNKISLLNLPEVPDSVDHAFQNLTDVPTKNIGQTFGDIWYLVFGSISHAADKKRMKYAEDLKQYHKDLTQSINQIPENQKVEPSIQVTAQALENSKYCISSETLRDMFVKLISGTMNADLEPLVHPSFPEIIKQMSENDAHLLMELKRLKHDAPVAEFQELFNENSSNIVHFTNAYISNIFKLSLPECSCSLSSLERMGLISISYDNHFTKTSLYNPFLDTTIYKEIEKEISSFDRNSKISLKKGICSVTPLGKRFLATCVL